MTEASVAAFCSTWKIYLGKNKNNWPLAQDSQASPMTKLPCHGIQRAHKPPFGVPAQTARPGAQDRPSAAREKGEQPGREQC